MKFELISFKTCPYVQRAVITLNHKNLEHSVTYIDLADPPAWFHEVSPLGKVPVLKVDGEILFESAVINEFINDISGGDLLPQDPIERARSRAWIEFASNMLGNSYMMKVATDREGYERYRDALFAQLQRVEGEFGAGPWFNGDDFSLVDTTFAPLFMHDALAEGKLSLVEPATLPKLSAWATRLLKLPEVRNSVVEDFESLYLSALERANTFSWQQYAA